MLQIDDPRARARERWAWAYLVIVIGVFTFLGVGAWDMAELQVEWSQLTRLSAEELGPPVETGADGKQPARLAMAFRQERKLGTWYLLTPYLSLNSALALSATCFGVLGGVLALLRTAVRRKCPLHPLPFLAQPLFSGGMGLAMFGAVYFLPQMLATATELQVKPGTLVFLAMFGGMFADEVFGWLDARMDHILNAPGEGEKAAVQPAQAKRAAGAAGKKGENKP